MAFGYGLGTVTAKPTGGASAPTPSAALPPACSSTVFASGIAGAGPMIFRGTDLYVATFDPGAASISIVKVTDAGVSSVFATIDLTGDPDLDYLFPTDIALDGSGNLYVTSGGRITGAYWKVTPGGAVSAISSGTGRGPSSIEFDGAGNLYATDAYEDVILKNGASFAASSVDVAFANGLLWDSSTLYALRLESIDQVSAAGAFSLVADIVTVNAWSFALQPGTGQFYFVDADSSPDLLASVRASGSPADVCSLGFDGATASDLEFGPDGALYASDYSGGAVFKIRLATPTETVQALVDQVAGLSVSPGTQNSLTVKLDAALDALAEGRTEAAAGQLKAFINEVKAKCCVPHSGKTLTQDEANSLIAAAEAVLATLP